jgi:hypothetical protein
MVVIGGRSRVSPWADHRSSNFGGWPVVSDTEVFGWVMFGEAASSGGCWADVIPAPMSSAAMADMNFRIGKSSLFVLIRGNASSTVRFLKGASA